MSGQTNHNYEILFEPVKIGPVTTPNRFFQVPHCNGAGYRDPSANAAMRRIKAEGGWGVVCTEQIEIHHTSEITPFIELRLWDDKDIPMMAKIADAIHEGGALAGAELCYNGLNGPNLYSRETPLAPMHLPVLSFSNEPVQARAMDKSDIRDLRRWHKNAALRAKKAGFDLIYVYSAHGLGALQHFLSPHTNQRIDEYGGSLENRARLLKEMIQDTRDAVGDTCAVPARILIDELIGAAGLSNAEIRDVVAMLSDLPDLWDFAHGSWDYCSATSRFADEGHMEDLVKGMKALTEKPVVGVGRFTSPDAMVRQVKSGILDLIGAARPSIADPFLPSKIREGRHEEIRECIGCNICTTGDMTQGLSRCTQNPTFMEEWRKGWHPEKIRTKTSDNKILIVGGGPAGLSAARAASLRGYEVALAERDEEFGGRVTKESRLPGLSAWSRVTDYRLTQLQQMSNVSLYRQSELIADEILNFGFNHIAIATGASWRRDGVARHNIKPIAVDPAMRLFTPDDLMSNAQPNGHVIIYDDDHFYMGGVIAELLHRAGNKVTFVTPAARISDWTYNTLEQGFIQKRLIESDIDLHLNKGLATVGPDSIEIACTYSDRRQVLDCDAVVLVTARLPNDQLYKELMENRENFAENNILSIKRIGDAEAPAPIAWATYAGHRYGEELDTDPSNDIVPFRRELACLSNE